MRTALHRPSSPWRTISVVLISITLTTMSISQTPPDPESNEPPVVPVITDEPPAGAVFAMEKLLETQTARGRSYFQFLRVPRLSSGIYALSAGAKDGQQPHDEDEIYYVVDGEGVIDIDGTDYPVKPRDVIYVRAHASHHFHSITKDLELLVVFAAN